MLLRRFHLQRIVEPIEIIEQSDGREQFDNFAFVEMLPQFRPEFIVDGVRVAGHAFREAQGGLFFFGEIAAIFEIAKVFDLVVAPAQPSCQDGV